MVFLSVFQKATTIPNKPTLIAALPFAFRQGIICTVTTSFKNI
jgi:hypothetical protein